MLLKDARLIKLKAGVSWKATLNDIVTNPLNLQIIPTLSRADS